MLSDLSLSLPLACGRDDQVKLSYSAANPFALAVALKAGAAVKAPLRFSQPVAPNTAKLVFSPSKRTVTLTVAKAVWPLAPPPCDGVALPPVPLGYLPLDHPQALPFVERSDEARIEVARGWFSETDWYGLQRALPSWRCPWRLGRSWRIASRLRF
jgi:hypothetical protein